MISVGNYQIGLKISKGGNDMAGINKWIGIGRLTADVETRYTQNSKQVCNFSIAVQEKKDGPTEFIRLIAWEKLAEICSQYLAKGKLIYAEGRLQTCSWDDKSGNKRYTTEIVLSNMQMLDKKGTVEETPNNQEDPPF